MKVGLFVTCLVDAMRPSIGFSTLELLQANGCEVMVPTAQTCCGQPAWNSGDKETALKLAVKWIKEFEHCDHVVIPSGSCTGMIVAHYAELFSDHPDLKFKMNALASKTRELSDFLVNIIGLDQLQLPRAHKHLPETITYHDSCSGLRELGIKQQPRALIERLGGIELREMNECEQCCGFGGTFSVKYGEVSAAICQDKCDNIKQSGAQAVVLGDMGCMMNIEGSLRRKGDSTKVLHLAELLTGRDEGEL